MSEKGIVWPGEMRKYGKSAYKPDQCVPPPFWQGATGRYGIPTGRYNDTNLFDPTTDEHFAVWMRTAGLPTFRKLYKRQDSNTMQAGRYAITIQDSESRAAAFGCACLADR